MNRMTLFQRSLVGCSRRRIGGAIGEASSLRHPKNSSWSKRSVSSQPVIEIREDHLLPQHTLSYFDAIRKSGTHPQNLCFVTRQELGGPRNVATHAFYFEGGLAELQEQRKFEETETSLLTFLQSQQSSVYVEAPLVQEQSDFVVGLKKTLLTEDNTTINDDDCILELRRYNLKLGYDTVPKFLDLYGAGLPSKLHAPGTDPETSLVTLLYSEVGRLNEVIEVWRHGNGVPGMERSRVAARKAQEWRNAIASIADLAIEFRSTIHRPMLSSFRR